MGGLELSGGIIPISLPRALCRRTQVVADVLKRAVGRGDVAGRRVRDDRD